ncbi:MAG TPA: 2-C-methyl-D-erythritol 4-phosphate cytidylyltransferase [Porticoccaceae bacterium]
MTLWFVVPAAGRGTRLGEEIPKQYLSLAGRPLIEHTLSRLLSLEGQLPLVSPSIVVVLGRDDRHWPASTFATDPRILATPGGAERSDSVRAGLHLLADRAAPDDWVLVHDVARPCITIGDIVRLVKVLGDDPVGGILAAPVSDTLKQVAQHDRIRCTLERNHVWAALTPQMFRYGLLCQALDEAAAAGMAMTDESSAVEALGLTPRVVMGRRDNIKITHREDLVVAEAILTYQQRHLQTEVP